MLDKMTTEGDGIKRDLNERRNSLGFYIQQQSKLYGTKDFIARLTFEDFASKVRFKHGVPLIILDLLDYMIGTTFFSDHSKSMSPPRQYERFDYTDEQFQEIKTQVDEGFLPHTWTLFNALGEIDFSLKQLTQAAEDCQVKQYLTIDSITRNLWRVFGSQNEFFSYMLFAFLSRGEPNNGRINYYQFLKNMMLIWPKKGDARILKGENMEF